MRQSFAGSIDTQDAPSFRVLCERVGSKDLNSSPKNGCPILAAFFAARVGIWTYVQKSFEPIHQNAPTFSTDFYRPKFI